MKPFDPSLRALALALAIVGAVAGRAEAQVPVCEGTDERGASTAFEEGNALMQEAANEARARHRERARELAAEALAHFDRQCVLGDSSALAERGAALMLMGEMLRSAQSYDAYLTESPLESLDARTRRRVEPNLQPGTLTIELTGRSRDRLFVDDLDFGPVERESAIRLPYGTYRVEVRAPSGEVTTSMTLELTASVPAGRIEIGRAERTSGPVRVEPGEDEDPPGDRVEAVGEHNDEVPSAGASPRTDFTAWYVLTGVATGVFVATGVSLQLWADERARTYNMTCATGGMWQGCPALRSEYDGLFAGAIAGYVLAGVAAAGLVTTIVLDVTQPSSTAGASLACAPNLDPESPGIHCAGRF